jgi:hypothetical protein
MDVPTLIVALMPPLFAIAITPVGLADRYIQTAAHAAADEFRRVGFGDKKEAIVADIQGAIVRVAKASQLISNCLVTLFASISAVETTYYLPSDCGPVGYVATVILAFFAIAILGPVARFGIADLYIQRVRRPFGTRGRRTYAITYGTLIDRAFLVVNTLLVVAIVAVFQLSNASARPSTGTAPRSAQELDKATR